MSLTQTAQARWAAIPGPWKRAFFIALAANFFVFFYGMAQYPLGDHDVGYLKGVSYLSGGAIGRWFSPFLYTLNGFLQLPVFIQTLAMSFQILAGIGAVLLWKRDASFVHLLAGALLVSLIPFVNSHYYYHWMAHAFSFAQLCMISALAVAQKQTLPRLVLSSILVVIGLATYQPCALTFAVVWCGLLAAAAARWNGTAQDARNKAAELAFPLAALILGTCAYAASIAFFSLFHLIKLGNYQFAPVAESLTERSLRVIHAAFAHLWLSQPYSPRLLKILLLITTASGWAYFLWDAYNNKEQKPVLRVALLVLALAGLVVSSKSLFLFSGYEDMYLYRFAGSSLSYVYLFFLSALFSSASISGRNLGLVLICLIAPAFALNDLRAQEHIVHSNIHDLSTLNRVVARIENMDNFNPDAEYTIVQFGRTKPYIPTVYDDDYDVESVYFFRNTISQAWRPGFELELLSSYLRFNLRLSENSTEHPDILARAAHFAQGGKAFPHKDSCFLMDGNILVLIFNTDALQRALDREDLKRVLP